MSALALFSDGENYEEGESGDEGEDAEGGEGEAEADQADQDEDKKDAHPFDGEGLLAQEQASKLLVCDS